LLIAADDDCRLKINAGVLRFFSQKSLNHKSPSVLQNGATPVRDPAFGDALKRGKDKPSGCDGAPH
jgi:hypothetical protein